nr:hypothetical protein [uncultured Capnocytophaga sp.]
MKKIILTSVITTLIISCGYNHQEQMLYDYVNNGTQKVINTEAKNIGFKVKEIKKIKEITSNDSLSILEDRLSNVKKELLPKVKESLVTAHHLKETTENNLKEAMKFSSQEAKDFVVQLQATLEDTDKKIEEYQKLEKAYNSDFAGTEYQEAYKKVQEYKTMNNAKLSEVYKASYTIKNPILGNLEQTVTKTYYTNREGTKFISAKGEE